MLFCLKLALINKVSVDLESFFSFFSLKSDHLHFLYIYVFCCLNGKCYGLLSIVSIFFPLVFELLALSVFPRLFWTRRLFACYDRSISHARQHRRSSKVFRKSNGIKSVSCFHFFFFFFFFDL